MFHYLIVPYSKGEQHNLNQAKFRMRFPRQALDLRNVEDSHQHTVDTEDQPQGLLHLELCYEDMHYEDPRSNEPSWATATKNASALLHAHKHTLKSAHVDYTSQDVWRALGECKKLEVSVHFITVKQLQKNK